jgi:hypothetical protein
VITDEIADFAAALPRGRGIAGLDFGTKTIGVAVSDAFLSVATPLTTVKRRKFTQDAAELAGIVAKRNLAGLVLGLPRNMDGSEGPRANPPAPSPGTSRNCRNSRESPSPSGTSGSARLRPKRHSWRRIRHENVAQR